MEDEIFALYKDCFSTYTQRESTIIGILSDPKNYIIRYDDEKSGKITTVSVINKNSIYLLCVEKEHRNKGLGGKILEESEAYIKSQGFDEVRVGAGDSYIFPGVPMYDNAHEFFIKRGYEHSWGSCGCFDMELDLKDFKCYKYDINDTVDGIKYRYATTNDIDNIRAAVNDGEKGFTNYYMYPGLYQAGTSNPVLIAEYGGEVAGAIMLNIGTEKPDEGSVGCTVTANKYRNRGIATTMVQIATRQLQKAGLKKATLGYTYTYILNLYGRSGYKVSMEYFMAKKKL